jgi:hypothetical protein
MDYKNKQLKQNNYEQDLRRKRKDYPNKIWHNDKD